MRYVVQIYIIYLRIFSAYLCYIKKNLKTAQETEDSDERKQWIKIVFGIVLALGYGGLHVLKKLVVIYALGILL